MHQPLPMIRDSIPAAIKGPTGTPRNSATPSTVPTNKPATVEAGCSSNWRHARQATTPSRQLRWPKPTATEKTSRWFLAPLFYRLPMAPTPQSLRPQCQWWGHASPPMGKTSPTAWCEWPTAPKLPKWPSCFGWWCLSQPKPIKLTGWNRIPS